MLGFGLAIEPQLWALVFVMIRIGAAFVTAPVFSAITIPLPVRVALSGAIGVLVLAAHPVTPPAQLFAVATFLAIAAEALVGLALGFVLQVAFTAPLVASELIGVSMGIGLASTIDPQNGHSSPALGQFLQVMLTLLFLSVDGHLVLVDLLVRSYDALPPARRGSRLHNSRRSRCSAAMRFSPGCCWRCRSGSCCCASISSSA